MSDSPRTAPSKEQKSPARGMTTPPTTPMKLAGSQMSPPMAPIRATQIRLPVSLMTPPATPIIRDIVDTIHPDAPIRPGLVARPVANPVSRFTLFGMDTDQ